MKITKALQLATAIATSTMLIACGSSSNNNSASIKKVFDCTDSSTQGERVICIGEANDLSDSTIQSELITALATAKTGDTFVFPQGRYQLDQTISFTGKVDNTDVDNLTFKGAGMDKTIFDVSGASADGFKIENTDNLVFEDFGVYESNNNAIKIINADGIIMRRIATVWETDFQPTNGAYGLYPVQSSNILIEDSYVQGSADAGIYVGQSDNIVVRNNEAVKNVAGIEIENSTRADVYGNTARGNTGGILVFDLPIGSGKYGSGVRVFDNLVENNNAPNFAAGCTDEQVANNDCFEGGVHIVPPGTGVIILSTSDVEVFENTIKDHQTISIAISSYMLPDPALADTPNDDVGGEVMSYGDIHPYATLYMDGWNPLVRNINIHDNDISIAQGVNAPEGDLINDIIIGFGIYETNAGIISGNDRSKLPTILHDGVGQLLASTPNPGGSGESILQAITAGINQIADGLYNNVIKPQDANAPAPNAIDVSQYGAYGDAQGVCQSNNGVTGSTSQTSITSASIYELTPTANTFEDGEPLSKVEQALAGVEDLDILNDDTLTCNGAAYVGTAVAITLDGTTYGCGEDDTSSTFCSLN